MVIINDILFRHSCPIQIRVSDIDINGHVNNVIYGHYFSLGRLHYLQDLLGPLNWEEESVVIAYSAINYYKPVYLSDQPVCHTRVTGLGNKSIKMLQYLTLSNHTVWAAVNEIVLVCYHSRLKKSIPVPLIWREKISRYEELSG